MECAEYRVHVITMHRVHVRALYMFHRVKSAECMFAQSSVLSTRR